MRWSVRCFGGGQAPLNSGHDRTRKTEAGGHRGRRRGRSSRLIGDDEEGTLPALRSHRFELIDPLLAEHGGRIANTAGDSLLLEFSSVVDAVRCSLAMQEGMAVRNRDVDASRQIVFRVGIHIGDIVAEGGDMLGDGVNVAARLEGLAEPGGVCLSEDAHRQIRGKIDASFEDAGVTDSGR